MKTALITGITGQDGAYLSQLLLEKGYRVIGTHRRSSELNLWRLKRLGIERDVQLVPMELLEYANVQHVIEATYPDEVYNLAAQSFVGASFEQPLYTAEVNGLGPVRILEAIRVINPMGIKFYQASTSEMFGNARVPQDEMTPFRPRSPYAASKVYAHNMTVHYREAYGIFACCGILFNHESPLRGMEFVTRKITYATATGTTVTLGNMDAVRDWGFAGDYVEGMWKMMQLYPDDFVLATGVGSSVREFWERAGEPSYRIDPDLMRPSEVNQLIGNAIKAKQVLGWEPKTSLSELVLMMIEADRETQKVNE